MAEIIVINPEDALVLKYNGILSKKRMEEEAKWFKDKMGLNIKIIDERYEIAGIEESGKRVCKTVL